LRDACHAALRRLQVDYLDLYFCHRPDLETPIEETVRSMHDLVQQGKVLPGLQEKVFTLGPGEIGGPGQVGDVWHIMSVQDVRDAQRESLDEEATRKEARRKYIHAKMDEYTINLRKNGITVEVYQDRIVQLAQREADMVGQLAEKAQEPGSVTQQRLEEMQKLLKQ